MGNPADPDIDRYRSQAIRTASQRSLPTVESTGGILPTHHTNTTPAKLPKLSEAGGLSSTHGRGGSPPLRSSHDRATDEGTYGGGDGASDHRRDPEKSNHNDTADAISQSVPPPAPPPNTEDARSGDSAIKSTEQDQKKPPIITRMKNGCKRFGKHFKNAIFHSWVNVLLVAVPAGIAAEAAGLSPAAIFAINAVAIVPLAGMLSHATESVASRLGDTLGALLNVSFGNAVELIIFIIALVKNEIRIVQASLLGSILANLLLILGMAFLFGGLRFREQVYNSTVTQMSACLLSLSVMSLLLPTAFHASFNEQSANSADSAVLKVSRGTSVVLLIVYGLYLLFQLKSHAYMYESTPQEIIDEESHPGVLADIMNSSSSSSDDSSSSDSSDSDTSNSGSVATTTRKVKKMFKHRMRRKSSASTGSSKPTSKVPSVLSSPSTQERQDPLEHHIGSNTVSRRESVLAPADNLDADADHEDNGTSRRYDWATGRQMSHDGSKSPERKKHHKKHSKKEKKRRQREAAKNTEKEQDIEERKPTTHTDGPKVEFADDVLVVADHPAANQTPKLAFNMRQLSSRVRPALPSVLSNNVFVQPATPNPAPRPTPVRSQSAHNLRRTSSLPDRLNRQTTPSNANGPLPPYQHQRTSIRKSNSETTAITEDDEDPKQEENMSRTAAVMLLLISTALVAVCAEFMVDAIPEMIENSPSVSEAFIGLIILPIVGNAAEHVTAVTVAAKNKMDLAIGVAVGSSIQIALFVTPIVVLLGWILKTEMSLYFNLFETVSLFATAFVVNFLVLDGRSNYLEGSLLIASYVIIAIIAFFYPETQNQSSVGGAIGGTS
ncbi:hypothetical protein M409DRAFT_22728 [Zasmidium cellare ATCC 36951]|uniref:Sodium/calcium exchanger membrane region domain-containing protein n=1 Tax=Zasmidium cellare ATCC 36951 TaxID=1080233 RepID=A0A6A6CJU4_ZASCE|nr:uncharacterized protein M409DRAFT_22728 [Zasmidium cellare ATCC 36951]KAF2167301.1 hypothetical protein M409DRAFT_22728 [Zasmidium cellare ATCC 36951]